MSRATELAEWLKFYADAERFGSDNPKEIADILVYGRVRTVKTKEEI